jgi:hypothetical protein
MLYPDFKFKDLSKKQLLKLASEYNVKVNGSLPNNTTSEEELIELIENQLQVLEDGSIVRKDNKPSHKEVKLQGGAKIRLIII